MGRFHAVARNIGEPSSDSSYREVSRIGYNLEHRFNDNWVLHNAFQFGYVSILQQDVTIGTGLQSDNRRLNRLTVFDSNVLNGYIIDTNLVGQLKTGNIEHKLLIGFDWYRETFDLNNSTFARAPIDVFNPVYGSPLGRRTGTTQTQRINNTFGLYFQDQITLTDNLKLVLGGRFDWLDFDSRNRINGVKTTQSDDAFSPRVGIVYQPLKNTSFYASYSRSFEQVIGNDVRGNPFVPSRGTQYEVGVKIDLFNSQLSTTLALYDLTQTNVTTSDPNNPGFNIQTGEQRIRGVELISIGELAPNWKIVASYIYTDPRITSDRTFSGNFISNSPEHTASLWTTYTIPQGSLQGLGFGLGVFYVGDREGDNANTFILPNYVRTDAAIYYRQNNLRVQLNLQNLFNTLYYDAALNRARVNPGNPFEAVLNISWEI
ncbi:TonB-dependent siderophore receptor [Scytonema sp. NUACC26]|uniref:TonB-dependent siderophore receptor n=1 Tax=Scytonema sp. NUACC26 TaxID=3140176 RepID=UPI0034DBD2F5